MQSPCRLQGRRLPVGALCAGERARSAPALAQDGRAHTRQEVEQLLSRLESSSCRFERNGAWYSGQEAKAHLQKKYDYLVSHGRIQTTEDFIRDGASGSSMSGKPYRVQCEGQPAQESAAWLKQALQSVRKSAADAGKAHHP